MNQNKQHMSNFSSLDEWVVAQDWPSYTTRDHATWKNMYLRMGDVLKDRVCDEFFTGLESLKLPDQEVVRFDTLSATLSKATDWEYIAVSGFIPTDIFFHLLANRRFPSSRFMRDPDGLSYQELPDIFHDVYGHAPLLMNPVMADFMQAFGKAGIAAKTERQQLMLARLYWFTVEVGLVAHPSGLRAFGAAIASSEKETIFALHDKSPNILKFDHARVMRTPYSMYDLQETYFVINSLDDLLALSRDGFACVNDCDPSLPDLERGGLVATDQILQRGTGQYHDSLHSESVQN
jgi:phenylalanine-4-hydroxylase